MPYRLKRAQRPRRGPSLDRQKHPEEPAGTEFRADDYYPGGTGGGWLRSVDRSGVVGYQEKWYMLDWCQKVVEENMEPDPLRPPQPSPLEDALLQVFRIVKALWAWA